MRGVTGAIDHLAACVRPDSGGFGFQFAGFDGTRCVGIEVNGGCLPFQRQSTGGIGSPDHIAATDIIHLDRSEERRVGKECRL